MKPIVVTFADSVDYAIESISIYTGVSFRHFNVPFNRDHIPSSYTPMFNKVIVL